MSKHREGIEYMPCNKCAGEGFDEIKEKHGTFWFDCDDCEGTGKSMELSDERDAL